MTQWRREAFVGGILLLAAGEAWAGCSDVALPGVDYQRCQLDGSELARADLTGADLRSASFKRSVFDGALLDGIQGRRVKFVSASLEDVSFGGADLVEADFTSAKLSGATFAGANLYRARFFKADLRGADLSGARLDNTDFLQAQLEGATWTDGVTVCGPGSVGRCVPGPRPGAGADAGAPARGG